MLKALIYLVLLASALFMTHMGINAMYRRFNKQDDTARLWSFKATILRILYGPLKYLLWIAILLAFCYTYLKNFVHLPLLPLARLEQSLFVVFLAWTFWISLDEMQKHLRRTKEKDETTILLIGRTGSIIIIISTLLLLLPLLGVQVGGLLAFGGLSGIVLGFGVKDFLANIFGGFLLAFDQPFHIGDWIYTIDGKIDGHIEEIGWRLTRLRLQDKRVLYIPNSTFLSTLFVNASHMTHRRIVQVIPIRYEDSNKIREILAKLRLLIQNTESLDPKLNNLVHLTNIGTAGLEINITVYSKITRDSLHKIMLEDFLLKIYALLKENDIKIMQPTQVIQVEKPIDYGISNRVN